MSGLMDGLDRKIAGAQALNGVVRSMKALAASSIGQYENAVAALQDYHRTVELGLSACIGQRAPATPAHARSPADSIGAVIFGSDQGLVGRFNEVLVEFSVRTLEALPGTRRRIWAVGERMHALTAGNGLPTASTLPVPNSVGAIAPLVGQILIALELAREHGDIGSIYVFHNAPKSASLYQPTVRRLLPLDDHWQNPRAARDWPTRYVPQPIDGAVTALEAFIREHFFILLFRSCAESLASENASRLEAMQRAEKNIEQILDELNRLYHRLRQESIDGELFEVISGYESLVGRNSRSGRGSFP